MRSSFESFTEGCSLQKTTKQQQHQEEEEEKRN